MTLSRRGEQKDSLELSTQHLHELVAFMYDHFDEFKLILCRAEGTGYADFIEVLVELEVDRSEEYYALLRKKQYALREHDPSASSHDHKGLLYGGV